MTSASLHRLFLRAILDTSSTPFSLGFKEKPNPINYTFKYLNCPLHLHYNCFPLGYHHPLIGTSPSDVFLTISYPSLYFLSQVELLFPCFLSTPSSRRLSCLFTLYFLLLLKTAAGIYLILPTQYKKSIEVHFLSFLLELPLQ